MTIRLLQCSIVTNEFNELSSSSRASLCTAREMQPTDSPNKRRLWASAKEGDARGMRLQLGKF